MVTVILLRPGRGGSGKNYNLIEGWSETPLTPEGKIQVRAAAMKIKEHHQVEAILCSPLRRARDSGAIVETVLDLPMQFNGLLAERKFGTLEGKTWDEATRLCGFDVRRRDRDGTYDYRPWKGDSADDIRGNIGYLKAHLRKYFDGRTVVCITHAGVLRLLGFEVPRTASAEYKVVQW